MEKVDFLNYRALVLEVRQLKSHLASLERAMDSISGPQLSFTPKGPHSGGSPVERQVVRFLDVQELYKAKLTEKLAQLVIVEQAIDSLDSPAERLVMRLRYMEGRSWASVCSLLQREGYSERQVYRLHGFALQKLKEV